MIAITRIDDKRDKIAFFWQNEKRPVSLNYYGLTFSFVSFISFSPLQL